MHADASVRERLEALHHFRKFSLPALIFGMAITSDMEKPCANRAKPDSHQLVLHQFLLDICIQHGRRDQPGQAK